MPYKDKEKQREVNRLCVARYRERCKLGIIPSHSYLKGKPSPLKGIKKNGKHKRKHGVCIVCNKEFGGIGYFCCETCKLTHKKELRAKQGKLYRERHKNEIAEKQKIYREQNKDVITLYKKTHIEEIKHRAKIYRETHKEQERIRKRIWTKNNPEKVKTYRQKHGNKYREIHKEEILENRRRWQEQCKKEGLCLECGLPALPTRMFCGLHLSQKRIAAKNYLKNPINKERNKSNVLKRYYRIKQENRCWGCGMPLNPESSSGVYCVTCADKQSIGR